MQHPCPQGTFDTHHAIVPCKTQAMQKNGGGSIVLTSAAVAESGVPHFEAMSAAKAGVEGRCSEDRR
jgi:NAD(P)-dependent dehydrogenase (short-subunit alcohol dehydrogenase family)